METIVENRNVVFHLMSGSPNLELKILAMCVKCTHKINFIKIGPCRSLHRFQTGRGTEIILRKSIYWYKIDFKMYISLKKLDTGVMVCHITCLYCALRQWWGARPLCMNGELKLNASCTVLILQLSSYFTVDA